MDELAQTLGQAATGAFTALCLVLVAGFLTLVMIPRLHTPVRAWLRPHAIHHVESGAAGGGTADVQTLPGPLASPHLFLRRFFAFDLCIFLARRPLIKSTHQPHPCRSRPRPGGAALAVALAHAALHQVQPQRVRHLLREAPLETWSQGQPANHSQPAGCTLPAPPAPLHLAPAVALPADKQLHRCLQASFLPMLFWLGLPELGRDLVCLVR